MELPNVAEDTTPLDLYAIPSLAKKPLRSNDDIVYSSLLSGSDNPLQTYQDAKEETTRTGSSVVVEDQIAQWELEQKEKLKPSVEEILVDTSIPPEIRREVARKYVTNAFPTLELRDKYLVKQASVDTAIDEADREAQNIYSESVLLRDSNNKLKEEQRILSEAGISFKDALKGTASMASKIALAIPAGLAAAFVWAKENDVAKANQVLEHITNWGYSPTEEGAQKTIEKISNVFETLDIPFKWLGDKTLQISGSPEAATAVYTASSFAGYLGAFKVGKAGVNAAIRKGKATTPELSPINTAETASKKASSELAVAALQDETGVVAEGLRTSKAAILNEQLLPKLEEEYGPIKADVRADLKTQEEIFYDLYDETELDPHVAPVSQILKDRDLYIKVLTETTNPHLLLSSSVIGTTGKAFGRTGTDREALINTSYNKLEGIAVFGRNQHHGYATQKGATTYLEKIKEATSHLPEKGELSIIERDGEHFVQWNFKKEYNAWEDLAFGTDALSAHIISPKFDVTWFANKAGEHLFPNYMRMREDIPASGATTALREARIEKVFLDAQRKFVLSTKHPKELVAMVRMGEKEGKLYTVNDFQTINQHLTKVQNEQLHAEYVGFRQIQDHLYRFSDRAYRKKLEKEGAKFLYDRGGKQIGIVSELVKIENPITKELEYDLSKIKKVWDVEKQQMIESNLLNKDSRIVRLKEPVKNGDDILEYGLLNPTHQLGEIRPGALTKIPGYVARHYKEWFVLEKTPTALWVNGVKVGKEELRNYKTAVAMGGTRGEMDELLERYKFEEEDSEFGIRAEEKNIEDSIIHDSKIYDTYLKEHHKRGKSLPSLNREADVEDILVSQTKTIKAVSKITAWDQVTEVNKKLFVKAYGKFTNHSFPDSINDITPLRRMTQAEEMEFLAAQKIYQQWEMQQISQLPSDALWKSTLNSVADTFERMDIDAPILREWGEKGFVPVRAAKALGSNLFLYARFLRMWAVQPQQMKELSIVSPSFAKSLHEVMPIVGGLLAKAHILHPLKSQADSIGRRMVKDYDDVIDALDKTGLLAAVNMNQMIHGFWRDSLKELAPKEMGKISSALNQTMETSAKVIAAPFKIGRAIGYDPAELTNQVTLWLFAKNRWEEQNPGKSWKTPEAREQIAQLQQRVGHMPSTRAGMFKWQDGTISVITQFAAIPYKSMMQMISAKEFTTAEKGKLAAARLFWYGKYGIPAGAALYSMIERNIEDDKLKVNMDKYAGGATDILWNSITGALFDQSGEATKLAASKSMSTVPESVWFYDLAETLLKMAQGQPTNQKFPFMSAGSSLFSSVQGMYDLFTIPTESGEEKDWSAITMKAVEFTNVLSDFSKSQMAEEINKSGQSLGYSRTSGEAVALLFGVRPEAEQAIWAANLNKIEREKKIKDDAKNIYQRLVSYQKSKGDPSQQENRNEYIKGFQAFMARVPSYYRNEIENELLRLDKMNHKNNKESILLYIYKENKNENDKYFLDLMNNVRRGDEEMQAFVKEAEEMRNK